MEIEDGESTYIICGEDPDLATKIIYFDDIQHKVSMVLTSIRNETFKNFSLKTEK